MMASLVYDRSLSDTTMASGIHELEQRRQELAQKMTKIQTNQRDRRIAEAHLIGGARERALGRMNRGLDGSSQAQVANSGDTHFSGKPFYVNSGGATNAGGIGLYSVGNSAMSSPAWEGDMSVTTGAPEGSGATKDNYRQQVSRQFSQATPVDEEISANQNLLAKKNKPPAIPKLLHEDAFNLLAAGGGSSGPSARGGNSGSAPATARSWSGYVRTSTSEKEKRLRELDSLAKELGIASTIDSHETTQRMKVDQVESSRGPPANMTGHVTDNAGVIVQEQSAAMRFLAARSYRTSTAMPSTSVAGAGTNAKPSTDEDRSDRSSLALFTGMAGERNQRINSSTSAILEARRALEAQSTELDRCRREYLDQVASGWPQWYQDLESEREHAMKEVELVQKRRDQARRCEEILECQRELQVFRAAVSAELDGRRTGDFLEKTTMVEEKGNSQGNEKMGNISQSGTEKIMGESTGAQNDATTMAVEGAE